MFRFNRHSKRNQCSIVRRVRFIFTSRIKSLTLSDTCWGILCSSDALHFPGKCFEMLIVYSHGERHRLAASLDLPLLRSM